jgi:endoglucanase
MPVIALALVMLAALTPSAGAGELAPLSVRGNAIIRDGTPFTLHGVNRDTLEWGRFNWRGCGGDGHFDDEDFDRIAGWRANAVRIPLSQAAWLGRRCDPTTYAGLVDRAVERANARGMYVILDLHWSDVGGRAPCDVGCPSGQQPMPDADSLRFWREIATRYANRPGVVFDLYNEPHDVSWPCWRDGGCTATSSTPGARVAYEAIGMQQLYDAVRQTGADNVVLVAGLDWAYDLSGVGGGYALRGSNIVYDTHVYLRWHSSVVDWEAHFGGVSGRFAVIATEFGSVDCSATMTAWLLAYFALRGISWTGWSWSAPGECSQPTVIADWSGRPMPDQGVLIHDALGYLAGRGPSGS